MQIFHAFVAWTLVQSICIVAGAALITPSLSRVVTADIQFPPSLFQPLALTSSSINGTTLHQSPTNKAPPPTHPSTTSTENFISYPVSGTPLTLRFYQLGARIPSAFMLQVLSISLTFILEYTIGGHGQEPIFGGFFTQEHLFPNGDNVTIIVADFAEVGRPMTYYMLRDTIRGIGDFMTEPGRGFTTSRYEIDVKDVGYVGTGHVSYDVAPRGTA